MSLQSPKPAANPTAVAKLDKTNTMPLPRNHHTAGFKRLKMTQGFWLGTSEAMFSFMCQKLIQKYYRFILLLFIPFIPCLGNVET